MEKLLDLDKLEKQRKRSKIRNVFIGSFISVILLGAGVSALAPKKTTSHPAPVTGDLTASNTSTPSTTNKTSTTPVVSSPTISTPIPSTSFTPSVTIPSHSNSTYTPYTAPISSGSNSNVSTPDPSQCPTIKSQEQSAIASLVAQNQQLETQLTNEDNAGETTQSQATVAQITANMNQITSIEAPYITQLAENECS